MIFCGRFLKASVNTLSRVLLNNGIRLFCTKEGAVQVVTFKSLRYKRQSKYDFSSVVLLVIPAAAFGLGTWQVFRKFEKDKFLDEYYQVISQPPIEIPQNLDELENLEFRKIKVKGKFDHSKEIFLGPCTKIDKFTFVRPSSLLSKNVGGYYVVTPFKLSDRNLTILINRGWVPNEKRPPKTRAEGQITEEVELVGLVRCQERETSHKKDSHSDIWFSFRDIKRMAEVTGASPVFLDADANSTVPNGPIGGQTVLEIQNQHLSYIFTWYGLATVSGYMWYAKHANRLRLVV